MGGVLAVVIFAASTVYAIAQIAVAFVGVEHYWGFVAAIAVNAACFFFRSSLPITIASFVGAYAVLGWAWYWAVLFAAPGLAFVFLATTTRGVAAVTSRLRRA